MGPTIIHVIPDTFEWCLTLCGEDRSYYSSQELEFLADYVEVYRGKIRPLSLLGELTYCSACVHNIQSNPLYILKSTDL